MMKNFKTIGVYLIFTLALLMIFASLQAQPGGGDPCPGGTPCNPDVPITGIEWLVVAGAALGIRKIAARKKGSE
jgi:hypothetical protein